MSVFYKYIDSVERRLAAPTIVRFRDEYSELARRFTSSEGRAEAERLLRAIEGRYISGFERSKPL